MNTPEEIRKLEEAEILLEHGKLNVAFYLAGYSMELSLKAKLCERFDIPNLFIDDIYNKKNNAKEHKKDNNNQDNKLKNSNQTDNEKDNDQTILQEIKKSIKKIAHTHNLRVLLLLCGLHSKLVEGIADNQELSESFTFILEWNSDARYKNEIYKTEDVKQLILSLKNKQGLLQWIKKN